MDKLPLHIALKLQKLMQPESSLPASSMAHKIVTKMLEDGILSKQQISNTKALIFITNKEKIADYLHNHFGITELNKYIESLDSNELSRSEAINIASNSKLKSIRSFKGFLINCYHPINAILNGKKIIIHPAEGSFTFIHDYESFTVDENVTIVGIENSEIFSAIKSQSYLFENIHPLFVSRYPQSNDLVKWLASIPNRYIHFGDMDFAGIGIYLSEYKKHLGAKASFFLPPNTESLLQQKGNRALFNKQYSIHRHFDDATEESIVQLNELLLKYKKVLEQEIFILP